MQSKTCPRYKDVLDIQELSTGPEHGQRHMGTYIPKSCATPVYAYCEGTVCVKSDEITFCSMTVEPGPLATIMSASPQTIHVHDVKLESKTWTFT